jgi:hypothetical protein
MPTVTQILNAFPTACILAGNDVAKSSLNGKRLDNDLPKKMYAIYFVLKKIYSINPNFTGVIAVANYLWELMGKYGVQALNYQSSGSGGSVTPIPINPITSQYLIPITGMSFKDATQYDNPTIVGKKLAIYWNDISRYLFSNEFTLTSTGINITAAGFDAVSNPTYELFIYIINP